MDRFTSWFKVARVPYLLLSAIIVFLGCAVAMSKGFFSGWISTLALVGLIAMHISVNLLNEYSDFRTGIDFHTSRTDISGGSGMITSGEVSPESVHCVAIGSLFTGLAVWCCLVWLSGIELLPVVLLGTIIVYFYTDFMARHGLGELSMALGLGLLPVLGIAFAQMGYYSPEAFVAGIAAGLLGFTLLLLNEFPDTEADLKGGRRHLVILLGKRGAGRVYVILTAITYLWIIGAILLDYAPTSCLIAVVSAPALWTTVKWAWINPEDQGPMMKALKRNLAVNHVCLFLLAAGFVISTFA